MSAPVTAAAHGLFSCRACSQVSRAVQNAQGMSCPRCGARLRFRKPHSISRTWAFLIAASVFSGASDPPPR